MYLADSTGGCNTLKTAQAVGVLQMKQRRRIYYTEAQKALMWERWQKGESLQKIAQLFDRNHSSVQGILAETGGIRPPERHRSRLALTLAEREEISRSLVLPAETLRVVLVDELHVNRNRFRHIGAPLLRERDADRDADLVARELCGRFDEFRVRLLDRGDRFRRAVDARQLDVLA